MYNNTKNNEEEYFNVKLKDVYNDAKFRKNVNWKDLIQEFRRCFPSQEIMDWEKVEINLKKFEMNKSAISKKMSLFYKELLRIKKDYYSYLEKRKNKSAGKIIDDAVEEKKIQKEKPIQINSSANPAIQTKTVINISKDSTLPKFNKNEQKLVSNLTKYYISFADIVKNKQFTKIIDLEGLKINANKILKKQNLNRGVNWKDLDKKLFSFMVNKLLNKLSNKSIENSILRQFEEVENHYQHFVKFKNVKEKDLKSLDSIIPNKNVRKEDKKNSKSEKKYVNSVPIKSKAKYCNKDCVKICQNNFPKYEDFASCSKSACLCDEFDILSKIPN